jgi:DNA polymerase III subunit epsilon
MFHVITNLAAMAEALSLSADYRLLRRLVPRMQSAPAAGQETRVGILIDNTPTVSQF